MSHYKAFSHAYRFIKNCRDLNRELGSFLIGQMDNSGARNRIFLTRLDFQENQCFLDNTLIKITPFPRFLQNLLDFRSSFPAEILLNSGHLRLYGAVYFFDILQCLYIIKIHLEYKTFIFQILLFHFTPRLLTIFGRKLLTRPSFFTTYIWKL